MTDTGSSSDNPDRLPVRLLRCWGRIVTALSFECLLTKLKLPNGGSVIVLRALLTAAWLYATALVLRNLLDPSRTWEFNPLELRNQLLQTGAWFGAIFAAFYTALYARFASQWTYLANLYNQIKGAESRAWEKGSNVDHNPALAAWKAGFIEDAEELHLATKPLFASVIRVWACQENVKQAFI
ncbi:unnamed protein product, partial [marine sediment metagenome]